MDLDEMREHLFELARMVTLSSSGDGCVVIVSRQYERLAKDFEEYENLHGNYFVKREDDNIHHQISFSPDEGEFESQEGVVFCSDVSVRTVFDCYELVITAMDIFY
jgi:hypothetical protein